MDFVKKYWSSGEFTTSSGEAYEGYVGILNGKGYTFDKEEELTGNSNWSTQINCSDYYFDRILDEDLELPYNKSQVCVHANDFLNKSTIKTILARLQANNDYIFRSAILSDTLIPAIDDCSLYATEDLSDYYFVYINDEGEEERIKEITDDNIQYIIDSMVINPLYDTSISLYSNSCSYTQSDGTIIEGCVPLYKDGKSLIPSESYENCIYIPYTIYEEILTYGKLIRNNLSAVKTTKTALDPTFYPIDGKEEQLIFNFHDITSNKILISSM